MVVPNLREKFKELGLNFPKADPNSEVRDYENKLFLEIDVMFENGNKTLLVEVKTTLITEDAKNHIKRLEKMRTYADLHCDKRTFLGTIAGVIMIHSERQAEKLVIFYCIVVILFSFTHFLSKFPSLRILQLIYTEVFSLF